MLQLTANLSSSKAAGTLYEPLDFVLVRAPLLPVSSYIELANGECRSELLQDVRVRRALAAGSMSLLGAIERYENGGLTPRDADRMRSRLLRYLIRMSTRPTPYGLFAGVALARLDTKTDLAIHSTCSATRMRPDMAWLMDLVFSAEKDPAIRMRLRMRSNPLITFAGGRASLPDRAPGLP